MWGYHLMIDAADCTGASDPNHIRTFVEDLVKAIDMTAFGFPWLARFGSGDLTGVTCIQPIETSNICLHACDNNGDIYLDVFSCKQFDPHVAVELFAKHFSPKSIRPTYLERDARHG